MAETKIQQAAKKSLGNQLEKKEVNTQVGFVTGIRDQLRRLKPDLRDAMLKKMDENYVISIATSVLRLRPDLAECTPISIISGIFLSMQTGLSLDPVQKLASLVPRNNKKTGKKEANFMPEYRGYQFLAWNAEKILIHADLVYKGDTFEYRIDNGKEIVNHAPNVFGDRGELQGCYAVATFPDGRYKVAVMPIKEVEMIRSRAPGADSGPWKTDYTEMVRKTAIRRIAKFIPLSKFTEVADLDAAATLGTQVLDQDSGEVRAIFEPEPDAASPETKQLPVETKPPHSETAKAPVEIKKEPVKSEPKKQEPSKEKAPQSTGPLPENFDAKLVEETSEKINALKNVSLSMEIFGHLRKCLNEGLMSEKHYNELSHALKTKCESFAKK